MKSNPPTWVWVTSAVALVGVGAYVWNARKPEEPTKPARSIIKRGDIATTFKTTKLSSQKAAPLKMTQQQMDLQKKAGAAFFKPSTSVSE